MDSGQAIGVVVVVAILVLIGGWLGRGWAARRAAQAGLPALDPPPPDLGDALLIDDVFYLATTRAEDPTDRVAVHGLAFRARAVVGVHPDGVVLDLAGAPDAFIPRSAIVGCGRATWTIDTVVERDGLVFLRWRLGDLVVDSNLRSTDPARLLDALTSLAPQEIA